MATRKQISYAKFLMSNIGYTVKEQEKAIKWIKNSPIKEFSEFINFLINLNIKTK